MEIYALIGHSGTGKSHQAPVIAKQYSIEYIIDDGLLIKGSVALAGRSAKRENTRYGAIKRALFKDPEHAQQVKEKLSEIKPGRLLILGTSRKMTNVIAENLGLQKPAYYYNIEEVTDSESIQTALTVRAKENRHVIPLPTFAIKKEFPGYIIDPLRSFFSFPTAMPAGIPMERSVVRPVYSTLGGFFISEHVVNELVEHIISRFPGVHKAIIIDLQNGSSKAILNVDLAIALTKVPDMRIDTLLRDVQRTLKEEIEFQTGFYLNEVNVKAKKIFIEEEECKDKKSLRKKITSQ
ncbi:MAG: hypothetical protein SCJ97_01290 [Bacillota bacterium]|nr:hypothetical protein [Bacillota bacterium]